MTVANNVMSQEIEQLTKKVSRAKVLCKNMSHEYINAEKLVTQFSALEDKVKGLNRKPVIGCFGAFDSGKSTFLNTIMGKKTLPESYQPATSVITLIMHITDKPDTIQGKVAIFKKGFFPHMIHSKECIDKYLIEDGDDDLLHKRGVHDYDEDEDVTNDAYTAIIFEDIELLKTIWLLDTPGDFNTADDEDTEKALVGLEVADIIIYISNQTGFLSGQELGYLTQVLRHKPPFNPEKPLEHILFIQSHCHPSLSEENIKQTQSKCFKRLNKENGPLRKTVFDSWIEDGAIIKPPTTEDLIERTHPFWRENDKYRENISKQISNIILYLNNENQKIVKKTLCSINKTSKNLLKAVIYDLEMKKSNTTQRAREVEEKDARFRKESHEIAENFQTLINSCKKEKADDLNKVEIAYNKLISIANIEKIIIDTYADTKEAQEAIGSYIGQLIQKEVEKMLKGSSIHINEEVMNLLDKWQKIVPNMNNNIIDESNSFNFGLNAQAVFAGGFAGLGGLGAMTVLTSIIAAGSNLGAYIAVAHVGGFLTSVGLISSPVAFTSFIAAIGGPITIGIAIAGGIGFAIFKRLSKKRWQHTLAEKVHNVITEKDFFTKIRKSANKFKNKKSCNDNPLTTIKTIVNEFWDNTENAIKAGFDELQKETDSHIKGLIEEADINYDVDKLDKAIELVESLEQFD